MTNPDDNALVEVARLAMVNAPISDGVSFHALMRRFSQALEIPWTRQNGERKRVQWFAPPSPPSANRRPTMREPMKVFIVVVIVSCTLFMIGMYEIGWDRPCWFPARQLDYMFNGKHNICDRTTEANNAGR